MSALQELQNYTFVSKYARWIPEKNRRETWKEAVERVKNMMHTMYADKNISEEINWAYDMMYKKKFLEVKEDYNLVETLFLNVMLKFIIVQVHIVIA
jgi:hypothetical protein